MNRELLNILSAVQDGRMSVSEAEEKIRIEPFADLEYAKVDLQRKVRQGAAEVIYGAGKTSEQIVGIVQTMRRKGQNPILITRLAPEAAKSVADHLPSSDRMDYHEEAKIGIIGDLPTPFGIGKIAVVTGGTSDIPVAEEAVLTAQAMGNEVVRIYDVGVAGLHRLFAHMSELLSASVVIAVAGMEGALASVVGGLVDCPVIAVPTSIGYGASFGGLAALLAMLNSCAGGISVVNIDNGFGAGLTASRINHMGWVDTKAEKYNDGSSV